MRLSKRFLKEKGGAAAVEFAIMGAVMFGVMFGFFDIAYAFYVRNSFNHAVDASARNVYIHPDITNDEIKADVIDKLAKFSDKISTEVSLTDTGEVEYRVINVQMTYHYKSPWLHEFDVVLKGESRAPVLTYKADNS